MSFIQTPLKDLLVFSPTVWQDDRGYFFESHNKNTFLNKGLLFDFVQDNESYSTRGTLRGLHYQIPPFAQTKLVRVVTGEVLDVVVDLRPDSSTFGQSYSILLSGENKKQLLIPKGFAHGFLVTSKEAIFCYKCDNFYSKEHERGINYNDEELQIDWGMLPDQINISEKDLKLPSFSDFSFNHPAF